MHPHLAVMGEGRKPGKTIALQIREDMPERTLAIIRTQPTRDEMRQCLEQCAMASSRWLWDDYMECIYQALARSATVIFNIGQEG